MATGHSALNGLRTAAQSLTRSQVPKMHSTPSGTASDTRTKILEAAATAFAAGGFRASTTNSIAELAGVNEVTVFRHFPQKQQLYWEAINHKFCSSNLIAHLVESIPNESTPENFIESVSAQVLRGFRKDPSLARLLYFTVLELEDERRLLLQVHLKPLIQSFIGRIQSWVEFGKIRRVNSDTAAAAIIGVIFSQFTLEEFFGFQPASSLSAQQLATQCAEFCLSGLSHQDKRP
jgi:AcrR family transcriptional regulator